jgi:hypothetical protein
MKRSRKKPGKDRYTDYLMWVGGSYYGISEFIEEAKRLGVSKRVSHFPGDVVLGRTRVFLAHDVGERVRVGERTVRRGKRKGQTVPVYEKKKLRGPVVFGFFVVTGREVILPPGAQLPEHLRDRGVTTISVARAAAEVMRGCGHRSAFGLYLVSQVDPETMDEIVEYCKEADIKTDLRVEGGIVEMDPYRPCGLKRFRGFKMVNGDRILQGKPWKTWGLSGEEREVREIKMRATDKGVQSQMFPVEPTIDRRRLKVTRR